MEGSLATTGLHHPSPSPRATGKISIERTVINIFDALCSVSYARGDEPVSESLVRYKGRIAFHSYLITPFAWIQTSLQVMRDPRRILVGLAYCELLGSNEKLVIEFPCSARKALQLPPEVARSLQTRTKNHDYNAKDQAKPSPSSPSRNHDTRLGRYSPGPAKKFREHFFGAGVITDGESSPSGHPPCDAYKVRLTIGASPLSN